MAKEIITVRLPDGVNIEDIDNRAAEFDMSRSSYITKAVDVFLGFDPLSLMKIQGFASRIGAPAGVVMQNTTIKELAKKAAHHDVWGYDNEILIEFAKNDNDQYIVGDDLFYMLYKNFKQKETQDRIRQHLQDEIYGDLQGDDRQFMIDHRAGRAWETSEQYQKEKAELDAAYAKYNKDGELNRKNR